MSDNVGRGRMKGKFYLIVYFCAFLSVSCSSFSSVNRSGLSPYGNAQKLSSEQSDKVCKTGRPAACFASLISQSCEEGALAGFFTSQARLANKINCNLPTREFKFPVTSGELSSPFGYRKGSYHAGVDISARHGEPVFACADGVVTAAGRQRNLRGMGIIVTLEHGGNISSDYAHLSRALVSPGQRVKRGDRIGLIGSTGRSTSPHLHLQVRNGAQFFDPMIFFNQSQLSGIQIAENFLTPVRERLPKFRQRLARVRNWQ